MRFASTFRDRRRRQRDVPAVRRAFWLPVLLVVAMATLHAQRPGSPLFRGGTDLVVLQVSVLDAQHHFVSDLGIDDFAVYEEGERQSVVTFASADTPLDLMILLDTSSSMSLTLDLARRAAINLVRSLKPQDRASVVFFNDTVKVAQPLTGDVQRIEEAIRTASARGMTALYEAVYIANHELARAQESGEARRQAVVVLSDGEDTRSRIAFQDVLQQAHRAAVTVFAIMPSPPVPDWIRRTGMGQQVRFDMRRLAEVTGGRAFTPANAADLDSIYAEIAAELGQQYLLGYVPSTAGEGLRRVSVRVETRAGLRVRTRSGYYAGTSRLYAPPLSQPGASR